MRVEDEDGDTKFHANWSLVLTKSIRIIKTDTNHDSWCSFCPSKLGISSIIHWKLQNNTCKSLSGNEIKLASKGIDSIHSILFMFSYWELIPKTDLWDVNCQWEWVEMRETNEKNEVKKSREKQFDWENEKEYRSRSKDLGLVWFAILCLLRGQSVIPLKIYLASGNSRLKEMSQRKKPLFLSPAEKDVLFVVDSVCLEKREPFVANFPTLSWVKCVNIDSLELPVDASRQRWNGRSSEQE